MKRLATIFAIVFAFGLGACAGGELTAVTNCPDSDGKSKAVKDGGTVEICKGNEKNCFILFTADGGKTYTYIFNPKDGSGTEWALDEPMFQDRNSKGHLTGTGSKQYVPKKAGTLLFIAKDRNGREIGRMKITIKEKDC